MNEVSKAESVRAQMVHTNTNSSRRDAAAASHTATRGQGSGSKLPDTPLVEQSAGAKSTQEGRAPAELAKAVQSLNDYASSLQRDLQFSIDEELGRPIVHVVDRNTEEVIRQIPSEVTLRLARNLQISESVELQQVRDSGSDAFGAASVHRLGLVNTKV